MVFLVPSAYHDPHSPFEAEQRIRRPSSNDKKVQIGSDIPIVASKSKDAPVTNCGESGKGRRVEWD